MMPSITIISTLPPLVGLSPYTKELVRSLSEKIHVSVLGFRHLYPSFLYPGKLYDFSAEILEESDHLTIRNVLDWFNPFGWIVEAFRIKTPIVHAQWWSYPLAPAYFTVLGINKLRKKRIIITIHNVKPHEQNIIKTFLNNCIFHLADEYIVHTNQNKSELQKLTKNKKIHVIPHGLLTHPLKNITKQDARRQLGISPENKILLCFGHIRDYKGLDTAIKALALIKEQNVKLFIAGKCWGDWNPYDHLIKQFQLQDRVILRTDYIPTDEIEPIFKASDLVLLPYKFFDAQSGVGALIISYGIPMIVSNTGGLTEYASDDHCIIEPDDHTDLAKKIIEILNDSILYEKLIYDIENKKKDLSWETIAEKTIRIYQEEKK